jgi:hypothetical protein
VAKSGPATLSKGAQREIMNKLIALLIASIGLGGCNNSAAPTASAPPQKQFTIVDIKGDVLGMSYADYKKKHPGECNYYLGKNLCYTPNATYADLPASRSADFFHGQLLSVTYGVRHTFNVATAKDDDAELVKALESKFGGPNHDSGGLKLWDNGTISIMLSDTPANTDAFVTFTLNELQKQQWAEMDKAKEAHQAAAKKDM